MDQKQDRDSGSYVFTTNGDLICTEIEGRKFIGPTEFIDGRSRITLIPNDSVSQAYAVYVGTDFQIKSRDARWIDYREGAKRAVYLTSGEDEGSELCGLMDYNTFEFVTEPIFKNCAPFVGKYGIAVTLDSRLCAIDTEGEIVKDITDMFSEAINLNVINPYDERGFAVNFADSKIRILNADFETLLEIDGSRSGIDAIHEYIGEYAIMEYSGKQGIVDREGNVLLAAEYDFIMPFGGTHSYARKGEEYYIISLEKPSN